MLGEELRSAIKAFSVLASRLKKKPKNKAIKRILKRISENGSINARGRSIGKAKWDISLLAKIESDDTVATLYQIASSSEYHIEVRISAVKALGRIRGRKARKYALVVLSMLTKSLLPEDIQEKAIDSQEKQLDKIQDKETNIIAIIAFYRMMMDSRYPPGIRKKAAEQLGKMKKKKAKQYAREVLMEILFSQKAELSLRMVAAASIIRLAKTYEELEALMAKLLSVKGRAALEAMKEMKPSLASRVLYNLFLDPKNQHDVNTRLAAAERLAFLGTPESIRALNKASGEPGWVGLVAMDALLEIKEQKNTIHTMSSILSNKKAPHTKETKVPMKNRLMAARTLGKMKNPKALDALLKALKDPKNSPRVHIAVVKELKEKQSKKATDALYSVLVNKQQKTEVRAAAARALHDTGTLRARAKLESARKKLPVSRIIAKALETDLSKKAEKTPGQKLLR